MKTRFYLVLAVSLALAVNTYGYIKWFHGKSKKSAGEDSAAMIAASGIPGCKVDIDGVGVGITGAKGTLSIDDVEPGDHYLHVQCPEKKEWSYFISPLPGQRLQVDTQAAAKISQSAGTTAPDSAARARQLRHMVTEAVQLRANGQFKDAVELLRKATLLDPRNGDLHRELGITFLINHNWKEARVEMLEAIRLEPNSAGAHSGLAFALEKLGDLKGALSQYRICTQMDPHDTSYRDHYVQVLGMLYTQQKQKKH